ncbi:MAG: PAS domain-containing protein, partial [Betaproteobacteria bacterium]|nr:PAS domain-containing protein [Betaproteobacteria bacterium]
MPNLEALVHALNEPMMVLDTAGRILLATESVQALTGTSKSPILADAIAREDRARFKEVFGRIMAGELPSLTLTLQLAPLGIKPLPIALKLAPIISADGQIDTIGAWLRDMSQESKILSAQQILHEQLSTLMEHISDGCILENAEGRIELINAAVCHIFGLVEAPVSLIDTAVADLFALTAKATHVALTYTPPSAEMAAQRGFAVIAGQQIQHQTVPLHAESKLVGCLHVFSRLGATSEATSSTAAQMTLIENIVQQLAMTVEGAGKAIKRAEQLELPVQVLAHFHQVERAAQSAFSSVAGL